MGMPALAPVCARAGTLLRAMAAAVTRLMARETGLALRALLGEPATFIWAKSDPSVGDPSYGGSRPRSTQARVFDQTRSCGTKPCDYGGIGAGLRVWKCR